MNKPTIANRIVLGFIVVVITVPCYLELAEYLDLSLAWGMPQALITVGAGMVMLIDRLYIMLAKRFSI
tara:strand:+ start:1345 stop:1548 length:204 start_codon:yes stop_codon:yes gene_type:complete